MANLGGFYPTMFCSEMRCSCSRQTFILSISFNHIPSKEKNVPFFHTIAKTMFFPSSCRDTVRYPGGVAPFGFEVTGISDGWRQKNTQGFNQSQIIFPHTHAKRNKQTDKNKKKKSILEWNHRHIKKYLVKFSTPKNQGIRKPQPPPQILLSPPSFGIRTSPPPGYSEYTQMICFFHQNCRSFKATSVVVLFWHISMIYCF